MMHLIFLTPISVFICVIYVIKLRNLFPLQTKKDQKDQDPCRPKQIALIINCSISNLLLRFFNCIPTILSTTKNNLASGTSSWQGKQSFRKFQHQETDRATEPGFAGDIGAIEVSLIDRLTSVNPYTKTAHIAHTRSSKAAIK